MKSSWQCPDCGNTPVNHFIEKVNAAAGEIADCWPSGATVFTRAFFPDTIMHRAAPRFFRYLASVRIGVIVRKPDAATGGRARCIWLEAARRGITMWEFRPFGICREIFVAEIPAVKTGIKKTPIKKKIFVFEGLPRPSRTLSGKKGPPASLAWVDNKPFLKKMLAAAGVPVARGGTAFTWKHAREIFAKLKNAGVNTVIVKPSTGSRSRHTTTHITDKQELRMAYIRAKRLSPRILVEEELAGHIYRGTVIGGKIAGIRRKDPPQVIGDGIHTVRGLVAAENRKADQQGPVYTKIDIENGNFPLEKNIDLDAIPAQSKPVILSKKTSIGYGGGSTDVTDVAHPDIVTLLEKIAIVLDDQLVGADFILSDITLPLSGQPRSGIIECNSLPFIDVHLFPSSGPSRDTAGLLWDNIIANINFF